MNGKDNIEEFLHNNKPQVKDDPTFLLETQRRMKQVEGIKAEVDRQRSHSRVTLIVTLIIGIVVGVVATFIGYICPFNLDTKAGTMARIILFLTTWKQYFFILAAALSVSLALLLSRTRKAAF